MALCSVLGPSGDWVGGDELAIRRGVMGDSAVRSGDTCGSSNNIDIIMYLNGSCIWLTMQDRACLMNTTPPHFIHH